ncbi:MAG: methyl-accepting chemotaxis protein [Desulfobacteraceae bacterium]|nr:methyl-accepting chemotaxis protein [Desulfobacteraceae bacterium]
MNPGFKRRNYFINKELQGKYIFHYFLLVALGSGLFSLIFSFFSSNTLSIVYDNYHLQLGTTPGILLTKILSTQWFFIVIGGAVTIGITLFLTHRIAGPFYRLEKTLEAMNEKNLSGIIVLRKKDEGKELAEKINAFNGMLSSDLDRMLRHAEDINFYCKKADQDHLDEIKKINLDTIKILNEFKLLKD